MVGKFKVITLCGSTRFKDAYMEAQKRMTLEGNIVISVGLFGHSGDDEVWTEGTKEMLDQMHLRKIDMADEIYVINVGGYIGESTRREIEYAKKKGRVVRYYDENVYSPEEVYWGLGGDANSLPNRITPSQVKSLREGQIFVFGSNSQGIHGAGAARFAVEKFGAIMGIGEGLQGQSYAIPTMEGFDSLKLAVNRFSEFAHLNKNLQFYVTAIGCGIAGYTPEQIAPLFFEAAMLRNVYLPLCFWKVLVDMVRMKPSPDNPNIFQVEKKSKQNPYTDSDGNVYESYEAYCNSPDLDDYTIMLKLHDGIRTPQNEHERRLLQEMKDIKARGEIIDFSENIW